MTKEELYTELAKVAYESHFADSWDELHPRSIERAIWKQVVQEVMEKYEELYNEHVKVSA